MTTIDHLRNHISISLCPHPAPLVILTHTLVVCRMIARELRAILMQIILSPFPSSRSSVTSRMHCYFPCLLLSRVFFFPFFRRAATVLSAALPPARFRRDVSYAFVRVRAHVCIRVFYCREPPAYSSFSFSFLSFRSTMADHTRPTRAWSPSSVSKSLFFFCY